MPINLPELLGKLKIDTSDLSKVSKESKETFSGLSAEAKKNFALVGTAMVAAGAVLTREGKRIEDSNIRLKNTIQNVGGSYKDLKPQIDAATQTQQRYGHTISESQDVLNSFTLKLKDPAKAMEALALASDVAAAKNISLSDAAALVGKAYAGNKKALAQFGIDLTDAKGAIEAGQKATDAHTKATNNLKVAQEALSEVQARIKAQGFASAQDSRDLAEAATGVAKAQTEVAKTAAGLESGQKAAAKGSADLAAAMEQVKASVKGTNEELAGTFTGRLKALKVEIQDFIGTIGGKVGPVLIGIGTAFTTLSGVTTVLDSNFVSLARSKIAETFLAIKTSAAEAGVAATALKVTLIGLATAGIAIGLAVVFSEVAASIQRAKDAAAALANEIIKQSGSPAAAVRDLGAAIEKQKAALEASRNEHRDVAEALQFVSQKTRELQGGLEQLTGAQERQREVVRVAAEERKRHLAEIETAVGSEAAATAAGAAKDAEALAAMATASAAFKEAVSSAFEAATSVVQKFAAEENITKEQLLKSYADQVAAAQSWSKNLIELSHTTLDQGLVKDLAELGPKAAPLINAYLDAVRSGNAEVINKALTDLRKLETDTTNAVANAANIINNTKPKISVEAAEALRLIQAVKDSIAGVQGKTVTITYQAKGSWHPPYHEGGPVLHKGGPVDKMHTGGLKRNERPATLEVGEFVLRKEAVRALGMSTLRALNGVRNGAQPTAAGGRTTNIYNPTFAIQTIWDSRDPMSKRGVMQEIRDGLIGLDGEGR